MLFRSSAPGALEGRQGFLAVYNGAGHFRAEAISGFGGELEILSSGLMFKKYPCCGATHAPIDAALDLVRGGPITPEEVDSVTIAINKRRMPHVDRPAVAAGLEARFSVQYTVAAALTDGAIGLRHFGDAALARPDLKLMTSRVKAVGAERGESLSEACELTVKLKGGAMRSVKRESSEGRVADDYRGRVLAVYSMFWGMTPIGSLAAGFLANRLGVQTALAVNGVLILCYVPVLLRFTPVRHVD